MSSGGSKSGLKSDDFVFSREDNARCETWNVCGKGTNSETVRESATTLKGTFQNWVFPHEERLYMVLTLQPYARFLGSTFRVF